MGRTYQQVFICDEAKGGNSFGMAEIVSDNFSVVVESPLDNGSIFVTTE